MPARLASCDRRFSSAAACSTRLIGLRDRLIGDKRNTTTARPGVVAYAGERPD
jgi:hypothetical protein